MLEENSFYKKVSLLKKYGLKIRSIDRILDYGCGEGKMVEYLRSLNYEAFGVDVKIRDYNNILVKENVIRQMKLEKDNYLIPFENNYFDFIFSYQVFEHVMDYEKALCEINRVLKPKGFCLHQFPSYKLIIEPHVFVPFATRIKNYYWLYFWALIGIKNQFQEKKSAKQIADLNYNYLQKETNYLKRKHIEVLFKKYFERVIFVEPRFKNYFLSICFFLIKIIPMVLLPFGLYKRYFGQHNIICIK